MVNTSVTPQLELPLQQVAQLLKLPPYVVVRLAYRLLQQGAVRRGQSLFFSMAEFKHLQTSIQLLREGHSLHHVAATISPSQLTRTSREEIQSLTTAASISTTVNIKRLPPFQQIKPVVQPVKRTTVVATTVSATAVNTFPVLKKSSALPKAWCVSS
jgi:hypothetical protein